MCTIKTRKTDGFVLQKNIASSLSKQPGLPVYLLNEFCKDFNVNTRRQDQVDLASQATIDLVCNMVGKGDGACPPHSTFYTTYCTCCNVVFPNKDLDVNENGF